jgi:hypothetical protein
MRRAAGAARGAPEGVLGGVLHERGIGCDADRRHDGRARGGVAPGDPPAERRSGAEHGRGEDGRAVGGRDQGDLGAGSARAARRGSENERDDDRSEDWGGSTQNACWIGAPAWLRYPSLGNEVLQLIERALEPVGDIAPVLQQGLRDGLAELDQPPGRPTGGLGRRLAEVRRAEKKARRARRDQQKERTAPQSPLNLERLRRGVVPRTEEGLAESRSSSGAMLVPRQGRRERSYPKRYGRD